MCDKSVTPQDAAEVLVRSRDVLWDAACKFSDKYPGRKFNALDVHDFLVEIIDI
jgi:hypothetical protein